MLYIGSGANITQGRRPGGSGGPGSFPPPAPPRFLPFSPPVRPGSSPIEVKKDKNKNKLKEKIKHLEEENKKLRKDIDNMIKYAPGSDKYNEARKHFESLQKI